MASQALMKLLSFGFSILVVRHLGAEAYGQYAAVLAFGAIFIFIGDLGLSPYSVREVARWRDAPDGTDRAQALFGNLLLLRLLLAALAAVLVVVAAWLSGRPTLMVLAIALSSIGLVMYSVQGASDALLAGFERLDLTAAAKVLSQLAFVLVGAAALWLGSNYLGLISANVIAIAILTYLCWLGTRRLGLRPRRPDPSTWLMLLRASLPFGVITFTLGLSYKFDSVLLNIFRGDAETGYYNAAYNLVFSVALLSNVFNTALYPSLTRQAASGPGDMAAIYERTLRYLLVAALPLAAGVMVLADHLVPFLFTSQYGPAIPALQVLMWTAPLMFGSEFLGYVALIQGRERRVARAVTVSTGTNLLANLVLVPRFGFMGAAAMTVATEAILVAQYLWMLRVLIRQFDWSDVLVRPFAATVLMAGVLVIGHDLPLVVAIGMGALIYASLLVLFRVVGADELRFVQSLRSLSKV